MARYQLQKKDGQGLRWAALTHATNIIWGEWTEGISITNNYYELRMKSHKVIKLIYKLFWFLVELCILNTYILHHYSPTTGKQLTNFKDFRVALANLLIGKYNGRRWGRQVQCLPSPMPKRPTLDCSLPYKKWRTEEMPYCHTTGKRRESTWYCAGCKLALCHIGVQATDCFAKYHVHIGADDAN